MTPLDFVFRRAQALSARVRRGRYGQILLALSAAAAVSFSCGYHVAGKADTLPDTVRTIAIPPFQNATTEFKVEQYVTRAVTREFISRTRYQVIRDESQADAVLAGTVVNVLAVPAIFDPNTGRATRINMLTQLHVSLRERETGRALYENPNFEYREHYEVSTDPDAYFEERQSALIRTSEAAARSLVSAVLEGF